MSTKYTYIGFLYRQGDSLQDLITFCAPAEHIKQWGGVPAKTTRFHGGFQRALTKRYKKIMKFFEAGDVSPTSIIVAFREEQLKLTELGYSAAWSSPSELSYPTRLAHLSFEAIDADPTTADTQALAKQVADAMGKRLGEGDTPSAEDGDSGGQNEDSAIDDADEDADDTEDALDIGVSKLREFHDFVSSPEKISRWIADETEVFEEAKKSGKIGPDEMPPEIALRSLLLSLLKPAMIVDGQHRVNGAADASVREDIVFTVCALKDADWVEQVFQFVVLNKLAKPISKDFLTGLLNTSLTNEEIKTIEPQLERVGISNADRVIMRAINFNPSSPFLDMVALPGEVVGAQNTGKLSGQGMLRIAKRWRGIGGGSNKKTQKELKLFEKCLQGTNHKARVRDWVEQKWTTFFHAFWRTVRSKYEPAQIWVKDSGFHLLMIVTMFELEDYFIETKAAADTRFSSVADFENQTSTFFDDIPAVFFQHWEATGLQSGDGPAYIRDALRMFKDGSSHKDVKKESPLFKSRK
jgi:hypothetical protein